MNIMKHITEYDHLFTIDEDGDILLNAFDYGVLLTKDDLERMLRLIETRENEQ